MLGALIDEDVKKLVEDYRRDGFCVVREAFESYEVAAWQAECERLAADKELVHPNNMRTPFRMGATTNPERIDPVIDVSPVFKSLANDRRVTNVVREIFGGTEPCGFIQVCKNFGPPVDPSIEAPIEVTWTNVAGPDLMLADEECNDDDPGKPLAAGDYTIDLVQNDPLFAHRPLRMESLGPAADAAMRRRFFPDLVLLARDERGEVWGRR